MPARYYKEGGRGGGGGEGGLGGRRQGGGTTSSQGLVGSQRERAFVPGGQLRFRLRLKCSLCLTCCLFFCSCLKGRLENNKLDGTRLLF